MSKWVWHLDKPSAFRLLARDDIVVADTSALMIAVYSELIFADLTLYASALRLMRKLT